MEHTWWSKHTAGCFPWVSPLITQTAKKTCNQRSRANKINHFNASSRMFLSETGILFIYWLSFSFHYKSVAIGTHWLLAQFGATALIPVNAQQFHPPLLLHNQHGVNTMKKANNVWILLGKLSWPSRPPRRISGTLTALPMLLELLLYGTEQVRSQDSPLWKPHASETNQWCPWSLLNQEKSAKILP